MQDGKTPTADMNYARQTPTSDVRDNDRDGGWRDEEARAKLVAEQARIQQHYRRLVQQRQEGDQEHGELVEEVYQGVQDSRQGEALPASLAAARPGSRSGITGTPSDPRFANYEEIQRHLSRRQAQYHSQVSNNSVKVKGNCESYCRDESIQRDLIDQCQIFTSMSQYSLISRMVDN